MTGERMQEILETYIIGNISDAKKAVKRMSKADFLEFVYQCIQAGITKDKIERLIEGGK